MSELKTLRDINFEKSTFALNNISVIEILQTEAIKWYHKSDGNKHKFILEFFNLREEDIKLKEETLKR